MKIEVVHQLDAVTDLGFWKKAVILAKNYV
jgi:hypothetical protein